MSRNFCNPSSEKTFGNRYKLGSQDSPIFSDSQSWIAQHTVDFLHQFGGGGEAQVRRQGQHGFLPGVQEIKEGRYRAGVVAQGFLELDQLLPGDGGGLEA